MRDVLPLEQMLERYIARNWPVQSDIQDIRQDVYSKVYKSALSGLPDNTRAFVFATAKNLLIDKIRKNRIVSIETVMDFDELNVSINEAGPFQTTSARAELRVFQQGMENLPDRTRDVIYLRKVEGKSQKQTAKILGISEPTVERHVSKGIRALADYLYHHGILVGRHANSKKENSSR